MGASVIAGVDASPVFETGEHVLDPVTLLVEDRIVWVLDAVLGMWRDAGHDVSIGKRLPKGGGTVSSVGKQEAYVRQLIENRCSSLVVVGLALGKVKEQRTPLVIADHLQLGRQAAPTAANTPG